MNKRFNSNQKIYVRASDGCHVAAIKVDAMRDFIAGINGVVGKFPAPQPKENGQAVAAFVRSARKAKAAETMGAKASIK